MKYFKEGDKVRVVNTHRRPYHENIHGKVGVVETVGHGEANLGYYEVQLHAFDGFESPQKLKWLLGNRLTRIDD